MTTTEKTIQVNDPTGKKTVKAGDRVYAWVNTGTYNGYDQADISTMTIVRINRTTITVDVDHHGRRRIPPHVIDGIVDWE